MKHYTAEVLDSVHDLLKIGIALTSERDDDRLFEMILTEARKVTHADAGTLYLCDKQYLHFKIIQNDRLNIYQGGGGEVIDLPPVPMTEANVASYVAIHGEVVNIPDVYNSDRFDFTGPKKYDEITGYHTRSLLVIPLKKRDGEIIGVLQLINSLDQNGEVCPFPRHLELVSESLASQAGVALSNMQYIEEIDLLLNSFVEVMTTTIDARSPYNVNHTRSVVRLSEGLAKYLNRLYMDGLYPEFFDEQRLYQLVMAAWLHDIGKIAVPSSVMDKPTRLGRKYEGVKARFDLIGALQKIRHLEQGTDVGKQEEEIAALEAAWELICYCNDPSHFVDEQRQQQLVELSKLQYRDLQGEWQQYMTPDELECLMIPRGTLTITERSIMENHVVMTKVMLDKMHFNKKLQQVPLWAAAHHELLDGSGYPEGIKAEHIPLEVRIMTIADIFDALTATDRPYKKPMPAERALSILTSMAEEGKLDVGLVALFCDSKVWQQ